MKRYFLCLLSFLFVISSSFAFDILDSNDVVSEVFSINSPDVFVETSLNISNFSVKYKVNSVDLIKYYNFSDCSDSSNFCGTFSLLSLIENVNSTFSGSTQFNITVQNESKTIFLDFEKPIFNLIDSNVDAENLNLNLIFNYSDNTLVDSVKIYSKSLNTLTFVADVINKTNYTYNLASVDNLTLVFKVEDVAGNFLEVENFFEIDDIFAPVIISTFISLKDSIYTLTFNVEDENLSRYEIIYLDQTLSGVLSGTSQVKTIQLPYSTGNILLKLIDVSNNEVNKTITLSSKFSSSFSKVYSNLKEYTFTSNANSCVLEKIDTVTKNTVFTKSGTSFSLSLDISSVGEYDLSFYCEDSVQREYYTSKFFYDTNKPSIPTLELEVKSNGDIKIFWSEAKDSESDVNYILYRDSDKVYSGSSEKYTDNDVVYPNEYTYYLKVEDEAGNYIETDKIKDVPKKVNIIYTTNLELSQSVITNIFNLDLKSEKNSSIQVEVKNSGNIILNKNYSNVDGNSINLNLTLIEGMNEVKLTFTDNFDNEIVRVYTIDYSLPVLVAPELLEVEPIVVIEKKEVSPVIEPVNESVILTSTDSDEINLMSYLYIIIILVLVLYIIFYVLDFDLFDSNKSEKKKRYNHQEKKKVNKSNFSFDFMQKRKNDSKLGNSLSKIKEERIERQKNKQLEIDRTKKEIEHSSNLTAFQKKKFEDISNRNKFNFNVKTNHQKFEEKKIYTPSKLELLAGFISKKGDKIRNALHKKIDLKEVNKKKNHEKFDNYLGKVTTSVSYSKPTDYLLKTEIEKQRKKAEIEKVKLAEHAKKAEEQAKIDIVNLEKEEKKRIDSEKEVARKEDKAIARDSLDDYLNKKTKKKSFYFAEKFVNKDLDRGRK